MFLDPVPDPRRGALWIGAAPVDAGEGRVAAAVGGGWLVTFDGVQGVGGGLEVEAGWALTRRVAVSASVGVGAGLVREAGALGPARAWGGLLGARWLVVDEPTVRVAPFVAAAVGAGGAWAPGGLFAAGLDAPTSVVGGGVAFEVPFYGLVVDVAIPVGGVVLSGALPESVPLAPGPFAPLFLLSEAGFTWPLGEHASFRLGYVALAPSWSWRWHPGAWTLDVSGHTNLLTGHLAVRAGRTF